MSESGSSPSPTLKNALEEKGYREVDFPAAKKAVQTTFPWRNTLSIYIAVMRVWNALVIYQTVRASKYLSKAVLFMFYRLEYGSLQNIKQIIANSITSEQ